MISTDDWLVILNPNAGIRRGERDWPIIKKIFSDNDIAYHLEITKHKEHAITLTRSWVSQGYKKIIAIGGDGTFNEVANGILQQDKFLSTEVALGMIPIGTGNDWGRMYNIPLDYNDAIKTILRGNTFTQDACKVKYSEGEETFERYFVNMAGIGFDAAVAKKVNAQKETGRGGKLSYFMNIFSTLLSFKAKSVKISIDQKSFTEQVFSLTCGVCQFNGGGMKQLPHAIPDDGKLALTIIKKIRKIIVILNVKRLYSGSFINLPQVDQYSGKEISIESSQNLFLEIDGESVGHTPIGFTISPGVISVITNNK